MRRALVALSAALALLTGCSGEPEPPRGSPSPALWEVTGPSGAHGWLFGTAHSLPDGFDWRTPAFDAAFADSDMLVVELDLTDVDLDHLRVISTTPGLGLPSSRVDPAQREMVAQAFAEADIDEATLVNAETWMAALLLGTAFTDGEEQNGVDRALIMQADDRELLELEGFEGQMAIFDGLPLADQIDLLELAATDFETAGEDFRRLIEDWRAGNLAAIEAETRKGVGFDPELYAALLVDRNREWDRIIDQVLRDGGEPFVAVGAAHLVGDIGLPALLEARGYTVKRIQ